MNHNNPLNVVSNKDLYHLATKKTKLTFYAFSNDRNMFYSKKQSKNKM